MQLLLNHGNHNQVIIGFEKQFVSYEAITDCLVSVTSSRWAENWNKRLSCDEPVSVVCLTIDNCSDFKPLRIDSRHCLLDFHSFNVDLSRSYNRIHNAVIFTITNVYPK